VLVENFNDLGEIGQRPGQPIHFVDDHHIDPTRIYILQKPPEGRPFHCTTRKATVVVCLADGAPSLALLAGDERFAGFALGVERVEVLF
jgi:hypothetical protein